MRRRRRSIGHSLSTDSNVSISSIMKFLLLMIAVNAFYNHQSNNSRFLFVYSFPTGAGGCVGGIPAVGGIHLERDVIATPSFADLGMEVYIGANAFVPGSIVPLLANFDYTIVIATSATTPSDIAITSFKGFLIRAESLVDDTTTTTPGTDENDLITVLSIKDTTTTQNAQVCQLPVTGLTHTNPELKAVVSAGLRRNSAGFSTLDITLVFDNTVEASIYSYGNYSLQWVAPQTNPPTVGTTTVATNATATTTIPPTLTSSSFISLTSEPSNTVPPTNRTTYLPTIKGSDNDTTGPSLVSENPSNLLTSDSPTNLVTTIAPTNLVTTIAPTNLVTTITPTKLLSTIAPSIKITSTITTVVPSPTVIPTLAPTTGVTIISTLSYTKTAPPTTSMAPSKTPPTVEPTLNYDIPSSKFRPDEQVDSVRSPTHHSDKPHDDDHIYKPSDRKPDHSNSGRNNNNNHPGNNEVSIQNNMMMMITTTMKMNMMMKNSKNDMSYQRSSKKRMKSSKHVKYSLKDHHSKEDNHSKRMHSSGKGNQMSVRNNNNYSSSIRDDHQNNNNQNDQASMKMKKIQSHLFSVRKLLRQEEGHHHRHQDR